jgi:hypothetical protein
MDLGVYLKIFWRFRVILAIGLMFAALAGLITTARLVISDGVPKLEARQPVEYQSGSTLLVTQKGFPWGRAVLDEMVQVPGNEGKPAYVPRFGDGGRYSGLASLYAELAKSDSVMTEVSKRSAPDQRYETNVPREPQLGTPMPLVQIVGYGSSRESAIDVTQRATDGFQRFMSRQQRTNDIASDKAVELVVIQEPSQAKVFAGRSLVKPIFVFLAVMMVFLALTFALENLRPRREGAPEVPPGVQPIESQDRAMRRSA